MILEIAITSTLTALIAIATLLTSIMFTVTGYVTRKHEKDKAEEVKKDLKLKLADENSKALQTKLDLKAYNDELEIKMKQGIQILKKLYNPLIVSY